MSVFSAIPHRSKGIISIIIVIFCITVSAVMPVFAAENVTTVKVGVFSDGDFMKKSSSGEYIGYDIRYLYEIAKYANWKYEFVEEPGFDAAYKALEEGKIDIVPAFFKTPEREQKFLLSEDDMGKIYVAVMVPKNDTKHSYNDYDSFRGMKISIIKGSIDGEKAREWSENRGLGCEIIECDSEEEMLGKLDSGEVDAAVATYLGASFAYRVVAEFSPMEMYFAMTKADGQLMAQLNDAMNELSVNKPEFRTSVYRQYFSVSAANNSLSPAFSEDEKQFIASTRTLNVAIQVDNAPFSFIDKDGNLTGAVTEHYRNLSSLSGLKFNFVETRSMQDSIEKLKNKEVDIIGKITDDSALAEENGLRLTNDYFDMTMTSVTKNGTAPSGVKRTGIAESLIPVYKNVAEAGGNTVDDVIHFRNNDECFKALKAGKIDVAYLNTACANYMLNNDRASDYSTTAMNGYEYKIASAVRKDTDKNIYSILNKCIRSTSQTTMSEILLKYSINREQTLSSFINRVPTAVIVISVTGLVLVICILIILIMLLRKHMKKESLLAEEREATRRQEEALRVREKTNAERMEFFGNVSHDMRTPLNGILGYSDMALRSENDSDMRGYLRKIKISGEMLLSLVNDTLMISKIGNNKFVLSPEIVDADDLLDLVIVPVRSAAEAKNINFVVSVADDCKGYINADKVHFRKIFLNLLTNAVKFTQEGGEITFTAEVQDPPTNNCNRKFVVRDNGIGINSEFLKKIYEPFAQENQPGTMNSSGTGLGLAIVKQLVDFMHGNIEVKSEKGKGTEFTVYLPVEEVRGYTPEKSEERDYSLLNEKIILICEDNEMNTEIVKAMLEEKGMKAICAPDGESGIEAFIDSKENEISAILMDIRMPGMNGYDTARAIRNLDREDATSVPIIALSADAYEEDIKKCRDAGMNAHLAKPTEAVKMYDALLSGLKAAGRI